MNGQGKSKDIDIGKYFVGEWGDDTFWNRLHLI